MSEEQASYDVGQEESKSGIIRVKKDARYFAASNEPFNDKRLSWEARGLMGYLLSKPDNWEVRTMDVIKQGPAGEYKVRRMLAELRLCGYMNRIRRIGGGHLFYWITEVYESPAQNPSTSRLSTRGLSTCGKPRHLLKTKPVKTNPPSKEGAAKPARIKANDFPSNVLFREVTERYPAKANWHTVLKFISDVEKRLGRQPTRDDLFPFYEAWCGNGWRTGSIHWLEYAVKGELPKLNEKSKPDLTKIVREYAEEHGYGNAF